MNILLVEDDEHLGPSLKRQLIRRGHTVTLVTGIEESKQLVREKSFDVVLTDRNVLGGDGWTIRQVVDPSKTRVVLMTAKPPEEDVDFYMKGQDSFTKLWQMVEACPRERRARRSALFLAHSMRSRGTCRMLTMAHRWVVRKKIATMALMEGQAHLVPKNGVVRAAPALCGARVREDEFWETAAKKTKTCLTCRENKKKR